MKSFTSLNMLLLLLAGFISACNQQQQPEAGSNPAFKTIPATTSDNFLRNDTIAAGSGPLQVSVNPPALHIIRLPEGFRGGTFQGKGLVSKAGENTFQFAGEKQENLTLHVALPGRLALLPEGLKDQPGSVVLIYNPSPAGADEALQLMVGKQLAIGYRWQTAARPLDISDGTHPLLQQLPLAELPKGNHLADVRVQALADSGPIDLKPGEERSFTKEGKKYLAFVQTSLYLSKADEGEDGRSGYVLQAVVVPER